MSITTTDPDITLMTKSARVTISDRSGEYKYTNYHTHAVSEIGHNFILNSYDLFLVITEVVIGFKTVVYEVSEGQQQEFCVAVQDGTLESPVEVTVTTEDGTALGKTCSSSSRYCIRLVSAACL